MTPSADRLIRQTGGMLAVANRTAGEPTRLTKPHHDLRTATQRGRRSTYPRRLGDMAP